MPAEGPAAIEALARDVYAALAAGDSAALDALLAPDFVQELAAGLPAGIGGRRVGREAARDQGWWRIGRFYAVRAEPEEWVPCPDGRLLVRGVYRGRERAAGTPFEAAFAHLWSAAGRELTALWQLTDTASWPPVVDDRAARA